MIAYLDSSVVLRYILKGDNAIQRALSLERVFASEVLEIECKRVLHRYRMQNELDDRSFVIAMERLEKVIAGISLVKLSETIKKRAMGAFPVVIKTLDALHVATILVVGEQYPGETLLVFSHDESMNRCIRVLGFAAPLASGT